MGEVAGHKEVVVGLFVGVFQKVVCFEIGPRVLIYHHLGRSFPFHFLFQDRTVNNVSCLYPTFFSFFLLLAVAPYPGIFLQDKSTPDWMNSGQLSV